MKLIEVPLKKLVANNYNPNSMTPGEFKDLIYSIEKFGQIVPLLVRPEKDDKHIIVDGEHRHKAYEQLNHEKAWCIIAENYEDEDKYKMLTVALDEFRGKIDKSIVAKIFTKIDEETRIFLKHIDVMIDNETERNRSKSGFGDTKLDWDKLEAFEETSFKQPYSFIGTEGEIDQYRKLKSIVDELDMTELKLIVEHCSKRELDDDERMFLLCQLAHRRALTHIFMAFRANPKKPVTVVFRTDVENAQKLYDHIEQFAIEHEYPKFKNANKAKIGSNGT